jgi:23S rRNA pseudouridine2605 synthase
MRINRYIAQATGMSRRAADRAVSDGRIRINSAVAKTGQDVTDQQEVTIDGHVITPPVKTTTILLNKPAGYVCSRDGQGSKTIYHLLPEELHELKPIGRLDKNSSGLLLLTNDGLLAHELTHPSRQKIKKYEIKLDKSFQPLHRQMIQDYGVMLEDGPSKFAVERTNDDSELLWSVIMTEGRNRQIRRTFSALGYTVTQLNRTHFGNYTLGVLKLGKYSIINTTNE